MAAETPENVDATRGRRRATVEVKQSMRELSVKLAVYNRQVGALLDLQDRDLHCLDIINRHGPLTPTELARRAGQHPATTTAILDRLQRGGWIVRERDPKASDRRAVTIRALPDRNPELYGLLKGFNSTMDGICAGYTDSELALLADFLRRTAEGAQDATARLAGD